MNLLREKTNMNSKNLITLSDPHSMVSESYKMFRTNLSYLNIDQEKKVILFTSTTSEEGKTTSIANTAISFAQAGKKVLLIECDLRKARVHELFRLPQEPGLTNMLVDKKGLSEVIQIKSEISNLHILTSGPLPPNPSEMLSSHLFEKLILEARADYDMILIDAPPVLSVTDAAIISKVVDGVVLIIAYKETKKEAAKKAQKTLNKVNAHILGVLMTKAEIKKNSSYYYYYGNDKKKKKKSIKQMKS